MLVLSFLYSCGGGGSITTAKKIDNAPPVISGYISVSAIRVGETLNFLPTASDPDGDILIYSISGMPDWATFDQSSGLLKGTPLIENLGSLSAITISVTDGEFSSSIGPFNLVVTEPIFFINIEVDGIDPYRNMDFELSGCFIDDVDEECLDGDELITVNTNGTFSFEAGLETGSSFLLKVDRDPARQECTLSIEEGVIGSEDQTIAALCQPDESEALFALDKIHKMRLTMSVNEWNRFVLDTQRAKYKTFANGDAVPWYRWSHSEIYRQVNFEYLDNDGNVIDKLDNVGFKMRGNTSRQWPEYIYDSGGGIQSFKPRRFSFGLKFDEKFNDDEGVYSCIDSSGIEAAVIDYPCLNRLGKDLDEVPENDDRNFFGVEKLSFRFNRDDPSYQRELLAHDILNLRGVPAARAAHASIELVITGNGSFYGESLPQSFNMGIFQMVEQIDKPFLKRYFGKNGFLFKNGFNADLSNIEETDLTCIPYEENFSYFNRDFCKIGIEKTDPISREEWLGSQNFLIPEFVNSDINGEGKKSQFKPYQPLYDLKSKKKSIEEGRQLLQDFMVFLQSYPSSSQLEQQFDVLGFIKAQAVEISIGAVDHYTRAGNNYYLYLNPVSEKWTYIPTDFDFAFRDSHELSSYGSPSWYEAFRDITETYAFPWDEKIHWASRELGSVDPILWNIVFSEESNKDLLYSELQIILDSYINWETMKNKLSARNSLVQSAIEGTDAVSPDGCDFIYNPLAIDGSAEVNLCDSSDISIKQFLELRGATLQQELEYNGFNLGN